MYFLAHFDWQNRVLRGLGAEISISVLAVSRGLLFLSTCLRASKPGVAD